MSNLNGGMAVQEYEMGVNEEEDFLRIVMMAVRSYDDCNLVVLYHYICHGMVRLGFRFDLVLN